MWGGFGGGTTKKFDKPFSSSQLKANRDEARSRCKPDLTEHTRTLDRYLLVRTALQVAFNRRPLTLIVSAD